MDIDHKTFWSPISLFKKLELWSSDQIGNFFIPLIDLKSNEMIYDIGSGFSPLGTKFIPYLLPHGRIVGYDINEQILDLATANARKIGIDQQLTFQKQDAYTIDEQGLPLADLVMCQQLLVNLSDPVTALERMMNITKSSGRIFCLENVNFGAYVYRPDFSNKTNFKLSQIWQKLCVKGKIGYDYGDSTFGANLPKVFTKLGLYNVSWQIISSGLNVKPPYTSEFKKSFLSNFSEEQNRLSELILTKWGPKADLSDKKIKFFIDNIVKSDYDKYAVEHDLFLTQWYYPIMAIVGWMSPKQQKIQSENVEMKELE